MRISFELEATWDHLGAVLGPSWALLGPLGPFLGPLGAVLGPLGALLEPPWGHLGHFKEIKVSTQKHQKTLIRIAFLGPRGFQDGPKLGQVGVKLRS